MTTQPPDLWTLDSLVEAYKQYQRRTRGLRDGTLEGYDRVVRPLVREALGEDPIDPTHISPSNVRRFDKRSVGSRFDESGAHGTTVVLPLSAGSGTVRWPT